MATLPPLPAQAPAGVTSMTPGETGFWERFLCAERESALPQLLPPAGRTEVGRCDAPSPGWHLHTDTAGGDAANLLGRQIGRASILHGPGLSALSPPHGEAHAPSRQADLREERRELPRCHMPNPRRNFYPSVTLMPVPRCGSTRRERGGSRTTSVCQGGAVGRVLQSPSNSDGGEGQAVLQGWALSSAIYLHSYCEEVLH